MKKVKKIVLIAGALVLLNFFSAQTCLANDNPSIGIDNINFTYDGTGSGCIFIYNAIDVGSIQFTLSWDPNVASLVSIDKSTTSFDNIYYTTDNDSGQLNLNAISLGNLSDEITVVCLNFERKDGTSGGTSCGLEFLNTEIYDSTPEGNYVTHTSVNGILNVGSKPSQNTNQPADDNDDSTTTSNKDPVAEFTVSNNVAYTGQIIMFNASESNDPDDDSLEYTWDFGDGEVGSGMEVSHKYSETGEYTVSLTVDDGKEGKDTKTKQIQILNQAPSKPTITGPTFGNKNVEYIFEVMSTDSDDDKVKYFIDWGDESKENTSFVNQSKSVEIKHTWENPGLYTISVYSNDGETNSSEVGYAVLIDAKLIEDFGYLMDEDGDGIYDCCYINSLNDSTNVKCLDNDTYLIDSNNDGNYDYSYNLVDENLNDYTDNDQNKGKAEEAELDVLVFLLLGGIIVIILAIIYVVFKKKNKKQPNK